MTDDRPSPGAEGYWSELEDAATDGGEVGPTGEELLEEAHEELDEPEAMLAAVATGEEGGKLYAITFSRKVRDGHLIITQRYGTVDPEEGTATLSSSNRLRMRMQGSLPTALRVLFSMLDDGALDDENPRMMDARSADGLDQAGNVLRTPVGDAAGVEADPGAEADDEDDDRGGEGRSVSVSESVEDRKAQARRDGYQCEECGAYGTPDDMKNMGGALGQDYWVHADRCPEDGENGGEEA
jgi:hypothetical protein